MPMTIAEDPCMMRGPWASDGQTDRLLLVPRRVLLNDPRNCENGEAVKASSNVATMPASPGRFFVRHAPGPSGHRQRPAALATSPAKPPASLERFRHHLQLTLSPRPRPRAPPLPEEVARPTIFLGKVRDDNPSMAMCDGSQGAPNEVHPGAVGSESHQRTTSSRLSST